MLTSREMSVYVVSDGYYVRICGLVSCKLWNI